MHTYIHTYIYIYIYMNISNLDVFNDKKNNHDISMIF